VWLVLDSNGVIREIPKHLRVTALHGHRMAAVLEENGGTKQMRRRLLNPIDIVFTYAPCTNSWRTRRS
jgi:hypothetical protein